MGQELELLHKMNNHVFSIRQGITLIDPQDEEQKKILQLLDQKAKLLEQDWQEVKPGENCGTCAYISKVTRE